MIFLIGSNDLMCVVLDRDWASQRWSLNIFLVHPHIYICVVKEIYCHKVAGGREREKEKERIR